jgi:hypothetical protein
VPTISSITYGPFSPRFGSIWWQIASCRYSILLFGSVLMGFETNRIVHVNEGARFLGNASLARIDQAGETIKAPADPFQVVPEFRYLYAK